MSIKDLARLLFGKPLRRCAVAPLRVRLAVEEIEPRITPSNLNLSASAMPDVVQLGNPALISGSLSSTTPISSLSMTYVWGDTFTTSGPPITANPAITSMLIAESHTYASLGTYSILVTANAIYSDGTSDSALGTYTVNVVPAGGGGGGGGGTSGLPDVRVDAIFDTSETPTAPIGQFNIVRIGGNLSQPLTVNYQVSGTAVANVDYNSIANTGPFTGSVTFAPWAETATITVTTIDDLLYEDNETVVVTLAPNSAVYHMLTPAGMDICVIVDNDAAPVGTGTGLFGRYYNTENLTDVKKARIDADIDFDWQSDRPAFGVNADHFSARWTGKIEPRYTGEYTFYLSADDGVRMWVNGMQIIPDIQWGELPVSHFRKCCPVFQLNRVG